jgi:hypothetical protein
VPLFRSTPLSAITFSFSPSLLAAAPVVGAVSDGGGGKERWWSKKMKPDQLFPCGLHKLRFLITTIDIFN